MPTIKGPRTPSSVSVPQLTSFPLNNNKMKLLIALAFFVALAFAAEEAQPVENTADLAVDEQRWRGHGGYYGGYYHHRPSYYGGYNGYRRYRRSAEEISPALEADQVADAHNYGGYYRPYSRPYGGYYGGYRSGYYGRPYWG